jgi:hypothetical protein
MNLTNNQIFAINTALGDLVNTKLPGRFKFKLFKLKVAVERALEPVYKALEDVEESEAIEIANESQNLEIDTLTLDELEPLDLSISQLSALEPIMEEIK